MTVSDIKGYMQQRGQAPVVDIANNFGSEPDAVLGMLEHWQRKGRIVRISIPKCNGCNKCGDAAPELYRWVG
jgi:Na+-translocating ferredoxin:NAD+ oxidoreductase RNF subunit RnfB